jgi:L-fucose isomerase-like protein
MSTEFGILTVAPDFLVDEDTVQAITGDYVEALETLGGVPWTEENLADPAPLFLLVATGGTENVILKLQAKRESHEPNAPIFLIAHPANNSLPAALEVLARLQQNGAQGRIFYLQGAEDEAGLQQIEEAAQNLAVRRALHEVRIGLFGDPSDWLVASMPDPATVEATWGPDVVPIGMDEITQAMEQITEDDLRPILDALKGDASEIREPSEEEMRDVVRVHVALRRLVDEHELDALTVRCFDLVLNLKTTGCFGLAELTDEGFIAGCEGDLVSTVGLLWAYELLGEIPWMANPAQLDEDANAMWLAHCTVPRRRVESYRLRSHFESGLGVGIQGMLPTGPVTLLRIGGTEMKQLWLAEGEIVETGDAENLCRTQARVELSRSHVSDLLHAPLGNHLVLVPGHHADRLQAWWEMLIRER